VVEKEIPVVFKKVEDEAFGGEKRVNTMLISSRYNLSLEDKS
jgi:hypothetical protein